MVDFFEVRPEDITASRFQMVRKDPLQEQMRKTILEALAKVKKHPKRYGKTFWTLRPTKTCEWRTVSELVKFAKTRGDRIANWVEQALEWAQRIQNGETWEAICNKSDTEEWYRLVKWKEGYPQYVIVGGSRKSARSLPAAYVQACDYFSDRTLCYTIPLIVVHYYLPSVMYK